MVVETGPESGWTFLFSQRIAFQCFILSMHVGCGSCMNMRAGEH